MNLFEHAAQRADARRVAIEALIERPAQLGQRREGLAQCSVMTDEHFRRCRREGFIEVGGIDATLVVAATRTALWRLLLASQLFAIGPGIKPFRLGQRRLLLPSTRPLRQSKSRTIRTATAAAEPTTVNGTSRTGAINFSLSQRNRFARCSKSPSAAPGYSTSQ